MRTVALFINIYPGQEKVGYMGMSFPGNLTYLWEIFRSNTETSVKFWVVNKKFALGANWLWVQHVTLLSFRKSSHLIQSALPPLWRVTKGRAILLKVYSLQESQQQ